MNKKLTALCLTMTLALLLLTVRGHPQVAAHDAEPVLRGPDLTTAADSDIVTLSVAQALTTTVTYTVTDLGTLGGNISYARSINEAGQVVGWAATVEGPRRAYLWLPEPAYGLPAGMNDLGTLGGETSEAWDINDLGQVVGASEDGDEDNFAFLWLPEPAYGLPAGMHNLGTLGGDTSTARSINNLGQVSGVAEVENGRDDHAFVWENGSMTDLGTLGGSNSDAYGINDSGQVAGSSWIDSSSIRAFLWDNGTMSNLGTLGGDDSLAYAINDLRQVVGRAQIANSVYHHAYLWLPEAHYGLEAGMNNLGTLGGPSSRAHGINDAGQVVGMSNAGPGQFHAFLWEDGAMVDLNDLIDPDAGWQLLQGEDINDAEQIVGHGYFEGQTRAFLLTPDEKAWTVMFYLAGDNDLSDTYPPILNQLELAADNPHVNVLVLWDGAEPGDSAYIEVQYDTDLNAFADHVEGENYWDKGELDTSWETTLTDFVTWGISNYPARHTALFLTDHGTGLGGGLNDDSIGFHMPLAGIQQALEDALTPVGETLDLLYFDMCLMGMIEVTYEMRDVADYVVSSQYLQWALDAPYFHYIAGIDADTTPPVLATLFADSYAAAAAAANNMPFTIAAVDMQSLDDVVAATDALARALHDNLGEIAFTLDDIAFAVQRYDTFEEDDREILGRYADLAHLARLIEQELSAYPEIVAEAQLLQTAIAAHVIAEHHDSSGGFDLNNSHGVAIFFPTSTHSYYDGANNDFAAGTDWGAIVPGALTPSAVAQESVAWGPLLVDFVRQVNRDAPDTPDPPEPVARLRPPSAGGRVFLPLVLR